MLAILKNLLTSEAFIPHGHCYLWKTGLVWFHIISDASIALAYYSIPLTLVYFVRKRKDFPFIWIVWFFGAFIVACGTTHVMEIWTLWHPTYWLSGLLKAFTALISIYTALALIPLIPKALALPSPAQLEQVNKELEHEIIERKLVEEALRESEQRLRSAFDYAAIGMALVAPDGRWVQVNRSLCEIVGYSEQELLSTSFQAITHLDDLECDLNYVNQLLSGKIRYYQMEKRYFHKQGHIVWILLSSSLVRDREGEPLYFIAQIQDITQRKQVEAALRESEERYRAIVEDQTELIARFQPDGTLTFINEAYCRYFGQSRSNLIGNCYQPVLFPEDLLKVAQILNSLNLETPVGTIEHRVVVAEEVRWMQWMNRAIFDEQGDFVEFQSVGRDITERKQMEEALRQSEAREREKATELALALDQLKRTQSKLIQAEKMSSLGLMVAGIAHEINNPVSFIYANIKPASEYVQALLHLVELYQQHYLNPVKEITERLEISNLEFIKEDFPKLLVSMNDGAARISQIVRSLKNFSRHDQAECKQVNIHEGIDDTLLLIQHRLKQHPLYPEIIVIKEYGQLPKVECFPSELNQVFMNILCNAIDALDELTTDFRPMIRICTDVAKDSRVSVRIADNGVGIKPEVLPKIFDPFFTTKPFGKGTGLGLFICYQIVVEKHSGELTCHSVDGQGTEFVLELPIVVANCKHKRSTLLSNVK